MLKVKVKKKKFENQMAFFTQMNSRHVFLKQTKEFSVFPCIVGLSDHSAGVNYGRLREVNLAQHSAKHMVSNIVQSTTAGTGVSGM